MARQPSYVGMDQRTRAARQARAAYDKRRAAYKKAVRAAKRAGGSASDVG